ncbi:MAG TPA: protoporphyrinogen oxidase [Acidimicrobiales bacterium]|nr:protoporphyrinogen oxidase [Acidimicrobiales bacterium]
MPDPPGATAVTRGRARVVVVGGGITGLATAWHLRNGLGPEGADVVVVESTGHLGGKIRTEDLGGVPVEAGPDTFLARVPWAIDLARSLGLGDDLVAPATGVAYVCHRGRLLPFPTGTVLGVPVTAPSLLGAAQLSPVGKARAALDVVLPRRRRPLGPDPSVAEVIGSRLGRQVLDRLVEPLVGGINAGRADTLSLRSAAPQLAAAAASHRSLILGLRANRSAPAANRPAGAGDGPVFLSVAGGMERLVERLAASLVATELRLHTAATGLTAEDGRWRLTCRPGPDVVADAVVLTTPAFVVAPLVAVASPDAAALLGRIRYASVVTATLAYRREHVPSLPAGSGFLVPRSEHRLMTACTFSSAKWPGLGGDDLVRLRASAGRLGDDRPRRLDDDALVGRLHDELATLVGVTGAPDAWRVDRWANGFPQYEPGHDRLVGRIEAQLSGLGGVFVAGASFRGVGIAACVQQAGAAASKVIEHLSQARSSAGET